MGEIGSGSVDGLGGVEASALDLAEDPLCERREFGVGVVDGDGLDGGVHGDGVRVAGGVALLVAGVGGPEDGELGFCGLGGAIGLLALAALGLGLADGDAGAVESEIERVGGGGLGLDDLALLLGDGTAEGFGGAFHQLGLDVESGELFEEFAAFGEAEAGAGDAGHAQRGGGQRGVVEPERPVAGREALGAVLTVIPGALKRQGAEGGSERLGPAAGVASLGAAVAGEAGALFVGGVGVEAASHCLAHDPQRDLSSGGLGRLEVDAVERARADQLFDFGGDLRGDRGREPPFLPAAARPPSGAPRRSGR